MDRNSAKVLTQFEIPAIFLLCAFLIGAAFVNDQGLWRIATTVLFSTAGIVLCVALHLASKYQHRWT